MNLTKSRAKKILYNLLRIRIADEEIAKVYPNDVIKCPIHLSTGSEAISVGVCMALKKTDFVIGGHRSHGMYLAKGGSLNKFMSELYGKTNGCSGGNGGSMHLIAKEVGLVGSTPILGSTIPIGVGVAFASKLKKENSITIIFFGDGASEEGSFYESLNLAALFKVPCIFVCENNRYSIFQEQKIRQPLDNIYKKGEAFGIQGERVDGNDVVEVYAASIRAVRKARKNEPYLIEGITNRWRQHVGPYYDYEIGFGTQEEIEKTMLTQDPVKIFTDRVRKAHLITNAEIKKIEKNVTKEVQQAFDYAQKGPLPQPESLYEHIY